MPQCKHNGCTFFAKVAFNLSKHESQCQFRHAATRVAPRQHLQQYNGGHARPLPHPCENDVFSVEENREIAPQPLSPTPSAYPGFIEDSYAEVSQLPSSELLVDTIILSLNSISSRAGESLTNDLIAVLRDNEFPMDLFRERVKDVSQVKRVSRAILQKQMAQCGFLKMELMDSTRTCSGILHYIDPIDVLRKQLSLSDHSNTTYIPQLRGGNAEGCRVFDNPMRSNFAEKVYVNIRTKVLCDHPEGMWYDYCHDGLAKTFSMVAFLQLFTDKTHTTLKASSVAAYPVHLTLQNFSDSFRRICINSGVSIIGYLPVETIELEDPEEDVHIPQTSMTDGRTKKLEILHSAMKVILSTLEQSVVSGFEAHTADGSTLRCHPALTSYVADLPKVNDMTATRGNQTARPCHQCMIPMSEMPYTHEHPVRTIQSLRSVRKTSRQMKEEAAREAHRGRPKAARDLKEDAKNIMTANSVALYTGFLESSLLVEYLNRECVMDIFAFEPLHNFHLGISKLLKTCICKRMRNRNGKNRITILTACNDLLALYQKESYVKDMQFNYTSTEKGNRVNGIFTNDGLRGMLEAKNYRAIDMVFPFVAASSTGVLGMKSPTR